MRLSTQALRILPVSVLLALTMSPLDALAESYPLTRSQSQQHYKQPSVDYYQYSEQAMDAMRKGNTTKAIDLFKKAHQLGPNDTAIINNMAVAYNKRGVYYQNTKRQYENAANDYRLALFYLEHAWPNGIALSANAKKNSDVAHSNLEGTLKNLNKPVDDWKFHLEEGWSLRRKGKLKEAMIEFAWVTRLNPKHSDAWAAMGDIYRVHLLNPKAVESYQKAIEHAKAPSDVLYEKLGSSLLKAGDRPKAVEQFNRAMAMNPTNRDVLLSLEQVWKQEIKVNPRNFSARVNLGAVYQQMERYDDAHAQYQIAERLSPNNPLIKLNMGLLFQAKGENAKAMAIFNEVLQKNPDNPQVLLSMAEIYREQGQTQKAEEALEKALNRAQDKKQILEQLIAVYSAKGDPVKIRQGWETYTKFFPADADVHYRAGLALHEQKDYTSAVGYYRKAIRLKPDNADAYANMGSALYAQKRFDEAKPALKKAIELNPDLDSVSSLLTAIDQEQSSKAYLEAARLHQDGKYADAVRSFEIAMKHNPDNADLQSRYGLSLQALKRYRDAEKAYDKAIKLDPKMAETYFYKATLYHEQNRLDDAHRLYEKAYTLNPQLAQAKEAAESLKAAGTQTKLSEALDAYNNQQYDRALRTAEAVLKSDPKNAYGHYIKGLVYDARDKTDLARHAYQKSVDLDPSFPDAVYALAVALDSLDKPGEAKTQYQRFIDLVKDQPEDEFVKYAKERLAAL